MKSTLVFPIRTTPDISQCSKYFFHSTLLIKIGSSLARTVEAVSSDHNIFCMYIFLLNFKVSSYLNQDSFLVVITHYTIRILNKLLALLPSFL